EHPAVGVGEDGPDGDAALGEAGSSLVDRRVQQSAPLGHDSHGNGNRPLARPHQASILETETVRPSVAARRPVGAARGRFYGTCPPTRCKTRKSEKIWPRRWNRAELNSYNQVEFGIAASGLFSVLARTSNVHDGIGCSPLTSDLSPPPCPTTYVA